MKIPPLDRNSDVPLHQQIENALRRLIASQAYQRGKLLPGEVELAQKLKVSRNTLRAAMSRLETEGLLLRTPKVGTRVARPRPHTSLAEWYSFTREMARQGIEVENYETRFTREGAAADVAEALAVPAGAALWLLWRVRGWDGRAAVVAVSWLHPSLNLRGDEDFSHPLYQVLHDAAGIVPAESREELEAIGADESIARSLGLKAGDPVLLRRRTIFDKDANPVEYNLNYYRTDRYRLTLSLRGA